MFERFTASARRVIVLAQSEARRLNEDHVGPQHLLLGVLMAEHATARAVLAPLGVEPEGVRRGAVATAAVNAGVPQRHIPFSEDAKKVLEDSLRESLALGHTYIGTEHIVLGLLDDPALDLDVGAVRAAIMRRLDSPDGSRPVEP